MKTSTKNLALLPALIIGINLMLAGRAPAQTFSNLYSFTAASTNASGVYTNSDGANPSGIILSGNTLYGAAAGGGSSGGGTIFAVHTDGSNFTNLYSFTALSALYPSIGTNSDGAGPNGLILAGNTLYGTAGIGGSSGRGTIFAVHTDGTGFTNLYSFTGDDGAYPNSLVLLSNTLYGSANVGGAWSVGTVFAIQTDGSGFTNLHSFTNSEGAYPNGLILAGNTLYGTTYLRGSYDWGTVFSIQTDGSNFTKLYDFHGPDGGNPVGGLVLSGNTLYGAANQGGGNFRRGTMFGINTNGTGFTSVYNFTDLSNSTNSDGVYPMAGPILWGDALFGTANFGGGLGNGTVFVVHADGTGFVNLHDFTGSDGGYPQAGLVLSDNNTLYGVSYYGGTSYQGGYAGSGTIFSIALPRPSPLTNYNFALDGGFESGDFSNWQLSGNVSSDTLVSTKSRYLHSGSFGAQCGPVGSLAYLSQTLPTYPGATYLLSFWLDGPDGESPNEFLASWDGTTLLDKTNLAAIGWTNIQFTVTATGLNTVLQFGFRDDNAYLGLDDVRVVRMLQPVSTGTSLSGANLVINGKNGLNGVTYRTLMSTNPAQPLNQWTPVATNVLGADGNFTITVTNTANPTVPRRFYILQLQ